MEINALIDNLRNRLIDYKKSELYSNKILRQDILSIEIATSLFEMAVFCNRPITNEEKYWFKGGYYISNDITGEWEDIAKLYEVLVAVTREKKFI